MRRLRRLAIAIFACAAMLGTPRAALAKPPAEHWLLVSDLHFNPFADPRLVPKLARAPVTQWQRIFRLDDAGPPSPFGSDTNYALLASALHTMKASTATPAVVVIAGDFLAHGFRKLYRATTRDSSQSGFDRFVDKTIAFVALEFNAMYPGAQFVPVVGNNDSYCGDYEATPRSPFFAHMAAAWAPLVTRHGFAPAFAADFASNGHYVAQSGLGIRLIAPNSIYWSARYHNACGDGSNPARGEVRWLARALNASSSANTWVLTHIPVGIDAYASERARSPVTMYGAATRQAVPALIDRAAVELVVSGHIHMNDVRVTPAGRPVLIVPAISPIFGNDPAYLDATVSARGVRDFSAYFLDLRTAPGAPEWRREYRFSRTYGLLGLTGPHVRALHARIVTDETVRARWSRFFVSNGKNAITPANWRDYWCAQTALQPPSYAACVRASPTP